MSCDPSSNFRCNDWPELDAFASARMAGSCPKASHKNRRLTYCNGYLRKLGSLPSHGEPVTIKESRGTDHKRTVINNACDRGSRQSRSQRVKRRQTVVAEYSIAI